MARVEVAPEVRDEWERGEGEVRLVLRSDADLTTAFAAMTEVSDHVRERPDDPIEMWEPTALPFGVGLFVVMDSPQYDAVMAGLVAGLEARGISGVLTSGGTGVSDPSHPLERERESLTPDLMTCRVSVVGKPSWPSPPYGWIVDDDVIGDLVASAVRWCRGGDPTRELHYSGADFAVTVDTDEIQRLLALQLRTGAPDARSVACALSVDVVRHVEFGMSAGYVALVSAPRGKMGGRWREHLEGVRSGLVAIAPIARYAMIRRGTTWNGLASANGWSRDWVAMPHLTRPRRLTRGQPLEDRHVPDAFGIQLLGPGHARGVPSSHDWTTTVVAGDRALLEHRDLAAWYARPRPDDATLRAARADLGALLMDDGLLER